MLCVAAATVGTRAGPATAAANLQGQVRPGDAYSNPRGDNSYNCARHATVADTVADCDQLRSRGRGSAWKAAVALAVADADIVLRSRTCYSSGDRLPADQALLLDGPELSSGYPDGSFAVRGFARDGWPIVIDFKPQPGTVTQMEVTVGSGGRQVTRTMIVDADGSRGRQLIKVEAPPTGARTPTPALYVLSSIPIAALDVDQPQSVEPAPLQVFGMGGGPRAVGSVAIEQVDFARANVGARFRFVAKSEFSQVRAQVQRLGRDGDRTVIAPVFDARQVNLTVGRHGGEWPGTAPGSRSLSKGPHRLQVTAWLTTDDRSWVAAIAPDIVVQ
jgi:hypothetical protein